MLCAGTTARAMHQVKSRTTVVLIAVARWELMFSVSCLANTAVIPAKTGTLGGGPSADVDDKQKKVVKTYFSE